MGASIGGRAILRTQARGSLLMSRDVWAHTGGANIGPANIGQALWDAAYKDRVTFSTVKHSMTSPVFKSS